MNSVITLYNVYHFTGVVCVLKSVGNKAFWARLGFLAAVLWLATGRKSRSHYTATQISWYIHPLLLLIRWPSGKCTKMRLHMYTTTQKQVGADLSDTSTSQWTEQLLLPKCVFSRMTTQNISPKWQLFDLWHTNTKCELSRHERTCAHTPTHRAEAALAASLYSSKSLHGLPAVNFSLHGGTSIFYCHFRLSGKRPRSI